MEAKHVHNNTTTDMTNGGHKASYRMQTSLIGLLAEMWKKIEIDSTLLEFFFNKHLESGGAAATSAAPSAPSAPSATAITPPRRPKLLIFTALIPFMQLHSRRTGMKVKQIIIFVFFLLGDQSNYIYTGSKSDIYYLLITELLFFLSSFFFSFSFFSLFFSSSKTHNGQAREAILSALSLRDAHLFDFIAHQTLFCRKLAEGLGAAYIALPSTLESRGKAQEKQSDAIQLEFVHRLQFCNAVVVACASDGSGAILAEYVCRR